MATVAELEAIAAAVPERFRAMVLIAGWCGLRLGELAALRRKAIDLVRSTVAVDESFQTMRDGSTTSGPPKSDAGYRTVDIPRSLLTVLEDHLGRFAQPGADGLLFVGKKGAVLRRNHWSGVWRKTVVSVGLGHLRFHDLRHTGNTLAAATPGTSTKDLMVRLGHSTSTAAIRYQHATAARGAAIAAALDDLRLGVVTPLPMGEGIVDPSTGRQRRSTKSTPVG